MLNLKDQLPYLGTAKWGETISKNNALKILDKFYDFGGRDIDTATNYPINSKPCDFGLALEWLIDWSYKNDIKDLRVLLKLGAVNNTGSSKNDLSPKNIDKIAGDYLSKFQENLSTISIHWDNRGIKPKDLDQVSRSIEALLVYKEKGINIGFSGLKYPEAYSKLNSFNGQWVVQVKENIFTSDDRNRYHTISSHAKFIAYGINAISYKNKHRKQEIFEFFHKENRKVCEDLKLNNFLGLSLLYSYCNNYLNGFIISPSSIDQLDDTLLQLSLICSMNIQSSEKKLIFQNIKAKALESL